MKTPRLVLLAIIAALTAAFARSADGEWISLFDGKTLNGWKTSENPDSPRVADGAIVAEGKRAHIFYVGADGQAEFENFELELEVKTEPGANSGVYFLTKWQDSGWPNAGFEAQVNNRQPPFKEYDYRENKKTASLYGTRNLYKPLAQDGEWFTMNIKVARPRVEIRLNGRLVSDYTEPANPVLPSPGPKINLLGKGTFALQCHDEDSRAYYRNIRVRRLPPGEDPGVAKPVYRDQDLRRLALGKDNFPIVNLRVKTDTQLTAEELERLRTTTGIFPGIVYRVSDFQDDASASRAAASLKDAPAFVGLDISAAASGLGLSEEREGTTDFFGGGPTRIFPDLLSLETRAGFDYLVVSRHVQAMVAERINMTEGAVNQALMEGHVARIVQVIETQPVDVYANVMVPPKGLNAPMEEMWTEERMQRVIAAAAKHGVAFEINRREPTPSLKFIQLAKGAGVKFTIGGDTATPEDYADWSYILEVQQKDKANLGWRDMWLPGHFPSRARRELAKK